MTNSLNYIHAGQVPQIHLPQVLAPDVFYHPEKLGSEEVVTYQPSFEKSERRSAVVPVSDRIMKEAVKKIKVQTGENKKLSFSEYESATRLSVWEKGLQPLFRAFEKSVQTGQRIVARYLYRKPLEFVRFHLLGEAGEIYRKYFTGKELDFNNLRWHVVEELFKEGKFKASFGHIIHPGMVLILSNIIATRLFIQSPAQQIRSIGRNLILPNGQIVPIHQAKLSPMVGISGMSFPQLSGRSILALLYAHLKHAQNGNHFFFNTGEGGPGFHLALLHGDKEWLKREVIFWAIKTGQMKAGQLGQHQVEVFLDILWQEREKLFAEFSEEDLRKAQIVAQFGTALNGIRDEHHRIDFQKLKEIGEDPHVAMIQYKLKQAAKRGSKLDVKKLDDITACLRGVQKGQTFKSPAISLEMDSFEDIAILIVATKLVTKKPVSLKFGIGDVRNAFDLMEYLKNMGALPDHIQIDGSGKAFTPGSGNAPPMGTMGTTSLGANEATIAMDAILKKLGVRDEVFLSVSGDVLLPVEGVEKMSLGADGIDAARLWMGQGLGCAKARKCADGTCPWGIAAKNGSVFDVSLQPDHIGPKAYEASKSWQDAFVQSLTETGTMDWRVFRETHGLHAEDNGVFIYNNEKQHIPLREFYSENYIYSILKSIMTEQEVREFVYENYPEEYVHYEIFNNARHLVKYLQGLMTDDPERQVEVQMFVERRLLNLAKFVSERRRSEKEIHDFIRQEVPEELLETGE